MYVCSPAHAERRLLTNKRQLCAPGTDRARVLAVVVWRGKDEMGGGWGAPAGRGVDQCLMIVGSAVYLNAYAFCGATWGISECMRSKMPQIDLFFSHLKCVHLIQFHLGLPSGQLSALPRPPG